MENNKYTLNEAEFAEAVGISRITAWRLRREGKLSHYRVGTRVLYSQKHVQDFLASCERVAGQQKRRTGASTRVEGRQADGTSIKLKENHRA